MEGTKQKIILEKFNTDDDKAIEYKILDIRAFDNILLLYLGLPRLEEWDGDGWDSPTFEDSLYVDKKYVTKTIQLIVNPEKFTVPTVYDMDDIGMVQFAKKEMINNHFPLFAIAPLTLNPTQMYWSSESGRVYMGDSIKIQPTKKYIMLGY